MSKVSQLMQKETSPVIFDAGYRKMIEDHLRYLLENAQGTLPITEELNLRCKHDFFALLTESSVPPQNFWIILRINGYRDPTDFMGDRSEIIMPDEGILSRLYKKYNARKK